MPSSGSWIERVQGSQDGHAHWGQFVLHCVPNDLVINSVVGMAQNVSHTTKALPVRPRHKRFGLFAQTKGRFGHDLQLPLDRRLGFQIVLVRLERQVTYKRPDMIDRVEDVAQVRCAVSKRQEWPHEEPLT